MNTDKRDTVLGISVLSKKAFARLQAEDKTIAGYAAEKTKTAKDGTPVIPDAEQTGVLCAAFGAEVPVYAGDPSSFLYVAETDGGFVKIVKTF